MAARKVDNLLEQALAIAQASGRSHQARLGSLLRLAARTFGLASASLFVPDPSEPILTQRYLAGASGIAQRCAIPFGVGCSGRAASQRTEFFSPHTDLHPEERGGAEAKCYHSVPVLDGDRLVGVLVLGSADAPLPAESFALCRRLLPVFSLTLAGLTAAETEQTSVRMMSLLSGLGHLLGSPSGAGTLLPRIARLCTGSGLAGLAVIRLTPNGRSRGRVFKSCQSSFRHDLEALLDAEQKLSACALAAGATRTEQVVLAGSGYRALSAPLGSNGSTMGALTLFGGPELLSPEQRGAAETLARLLSGTLAEAICKEKVASLDSENEKKLKELSLLYRLSNTMLSTIKLNKLIHLTLTALTSGPTPFFDRAMLFLTNERSGSLVGMLGVTTETSPPLSIPQGGGEDILSSRWDITEGEMAAQRDSDFCRKVQGKRLQLDGTLNIASQAVLEKRLIYIPDEAVIGADPAATAPRTALAASPLIAHGQTVGVVLVDNALTQAPITQEHLRFLQLFTNQAGMAIENSMLYNQIEDANRQLSEVQESLLQKERLAAIGEMAAGIAHELKGPLVSIGGFAGRLARKLPKETSEWAHADLIVREVVRLEGILSEILLFSKKTTICYARCDMVDVVKESLAVVTPPLEEKQIRITTKFPRQRQLLLGDSQQLKQVFINLILNSLDAMGNGGELMVQVLPCELDGKEAIAVKIADTGGGIPLEQLNSIFTPFFTTKESGTGLGLPIANRIITNHGGKIQITNQPGQGVEFRIVLPKHW